MSIFRAARTFEMLGAIQMNIVVSSFLYIKVTTTGDKHEFNFLGVVGGGTAPHSDSAFWDWEPR